MSEQTKPTTSDVYRLVNQHLRMAHKQDNIPPRNMKFQVGGSRAVLRFHSADHEGILAALFLEECGEDAMGVPTWGLTAKRLVTISLKGDEISVFENLARTTDPGAPTMLNLLTRQYWGVLEDHLRMYWDEHQV